MIATRLKGLLALAAGAAGFLAIHAALPKDSRLAGLPLAFGLMGALQLITGVPFTQLQNRWDSMPGLTRFLVGLAMIAAVVGGVVLYLAVNK